MKQLARLHWSTLAVSLVIAACLLLITALQFLDTVTRLRIIREGSYVELSSAIVWLAACVGYTFVARSDMGQIWHRATLLLLAGLRELDLHVRFTGESIFNEDTYFHAGISTGYRIYSILAIALIVTTLIRTVLVDARPLLTNLKRGERLAHLVACALGLLVVAKTIDGLRGRAEDLAWNLPWALFELAESAEEVLELGAPIIVTVAVIVAWQQRQQEIS